MREEDPSLTSKRKTRGRGAAKAVSQESVEERLAPPAPEDPPTVQKTTRKQRGLYRSTSHSKNTVCAFQSTYKLLSFTLEDS